MSQLKHHNSYEHSNVFTHAVVDTEYVHLSGQIASDPTTKAIWTGDAVSETKKCMEQIGKLLREVGLEYGNIVRVTVYVTDLNDVPEINRVYGTYFPDGRYPARSCVKVAGLIGGAKVEIEATARIPQSVNTVPLTQANTF